MKKTPVFDYEIMGSVSSWPVDVSMSRNKKSGLWTLYFNYVDPDARAFEKNSAETPYDFRLVAEERYMDIDSFCQALIDSNNIELIELGMRILNTPTIPTSSELPRKYWTTRNAAIEYVLSGSPLPSGLADLQEWLATDGWDDLLAAWINEDVALNLKEWATYKFFDSTMRDDQGLDSEAITDQMRVDYARASIREAVEQSEGYDSPSVHSFSIEREDGERAILGCTVEIHGQAGLVPQWHGIFADKEAFYVYLRDAGFLLHSIADEISDVEILSLWVIEKKKKKISKRL
jgi:hypothetical protein